MSCANDWRVEILDSSTGTRRRFVEPLSFEFQQQLNQVGTAQVTLPVRAVEMNDIWPHLRSMVFSRIAGPNASPLSPVPEFLGLIESVTASSDGTVQLALRSIEGYLSYRLIRDTYRPSDVSQTIIGATLVDMAGTDGVPLFGSSDSSVITRTRTDRYLPGNDLFIWEAVEELTQLEDGPDYQLIHREVDGSWSTEMLFQDWCGESRNYRLDARIGILEYGITVTGEEHRNVMVGRGDGDTSVSYTGSVLDSSPYPRFDRAETYSGVSTATALAELVNGAIQNDKHPRGVPSLSLTDLQVIDDMRMGDTVTLRMDYGALQYDGEARVVTRAWSSSADEPTSCTFEFVMPVTDNSADAILSVQSEGVRCD